MPRELTKLDRRVYQLAKERFPAYLSVAEVAQILEWPVDGIPSIARAFRRLREYDCAVEACVHGDLVKYRILPEGSAEPVRGRLVGRHERGAQAHSERSLTREDVREWATAKFPNWFTKGEAVSALRIDPNKVSSLHTLLTDLRKPSRGGLRVESRHIDGGLWEYRVWPESIEANAVS